GSILSGHEDIAASVQKLVEDILIARAQLLQKRSKANKLVFSGGVALNCLANMKIYEHAGFEEVFVPFGAGDSGSAIGCAALAQLSLDKKKIELESPYLGPSYQGGKLPFAKLWKKVSEQEVATLLSQDRIIGLFQGRSEFGPRALGNRSFLASPGKAEMKDILNEKVKGRESFRPFSPVVMDSIVSELTSYKYASKYMTMTVPILEKAQKLIPAAIHKDGTARVQVVSHEDNSFLYGILEAFYKTTKIPALLNTSFNLSDEPIVENIEDAFMCFLRSNADYLLIDGMILDRSLVPENIVENAKQFYRKRSSSISESVYTF
ncbi:MAG: hypothetical protein KC478_16675, partial [Bacteriovoracaceae bacterium]|nr:hypothetical protein [Bacteriovoracaceae bacterium]